MLCFRQIPLVFVVGCTFATAFPLLRARAEENSPDLSFESVAIEPLADPDAPLIKRLHDDSQTELLRHLGADTDKDGIRVNRIGSKRLVYHARYRTNATGSRGVFVYGAAMHSWPGIQPQTILITDAQYRLIAWKEIGGSPIFEGAELAVDDARGPVLVITRRHRHILVNPERGKHRVLLADDRIRELPDVEWIYANQAERERFDRIHQLLRERERASREQKASIPPGAGTPTSDAR